ncbi:hypothetical protein CISIN_1g0373431mg, partial [Citrus sinensis]
DGGNRKVSKSGSGGEDSAFKQQIGGHDSRLDGQDFTWQQIAASLGSWQQQIAEMRTAHGSRLDGFDMAATDRVLWWLVADLRVAAALFSCYLFVFV